MFRTEKEDKCGVGTVVSFGKDEQWMIVGENIIVGEGAYVMSLNLKTNIIETSLFVEDHTWLTREDFDSLFAFNNYPLSDYTIIPNKQLKVV